MAKLLSHEIRERFDFESRLVLNSALKTLNTYGFFRLLEELESSRVLESWESDPTKLAEVIIDSRKNSLIYRQLKDFADQFDPQEGNEDA